MQESTIEKFLVDEVTKINGKAYKIISPGNNGMPDRLIILKGKVFFVETKAPGKTLRPIQEYRKAELESLGAKVFKADNIDSIKEILNEIQSS